MIKEEVVVKKLIEKIIEILVRLWSCVYTYNLSAWFKNKHSALYSLWIRNFIGKVGEGVSIHYPCLIQGGGHNNISIGDNTCFQGHNVLGCWAKYIGQSFSPSITIGLECNIGEYTQITAINKIVIGDGLLTGRFVYIGDNAHGGLSVEEASIPPVKRRLTSKGEIVIGNNVWIGDKVTILGGVTIGDNVIVGANSVVTKNIPSNCIVAGVPAKIIKTL